MSSQLDLKSNGDLEMNFHQGTFITLFLLCLIYTNKAILDGNEEELQPYLVAIKNDVRYGFTLCTGTLIAETWVLTHAPCLHKLIGRIKIYLGITNIDEPNQVRSVINVYIQPDFQRHSRLSTNPLALIEISKSGTSSEKISTLKIAPKPWPDISKDCALHGFGYKLNRTDNTTDYGMLYGGNVPGIQKSTENGSCGCLDEIPKNIRNKILCNQQDEGRICPGDFGAPLVCSGPKNSSEPYLVGVAHNYVTCKDFNETEFYHEYGLLTPCSTDKVTDVYTEVYPFTLWITSVMSPSKVRYPSSIKKKKEKNCSQETPATIMLCKTFFCIYIFNCFINIF